MDRRSRSKICRRSRSPVPTSPSAGWTVRRRTTRLLQIAREVAKLAPNGEAPAQLEQGLAQVQQRIGFQLRDDLLGSLGSLVCGFDDPRQGILNMGAGAVIEVKDAPKLRSASIS
ncbi:MAG: hypothetical protein R3B90_23470 [Planctomycetaceae bacterium]